MSVRAWLRRAGLALLGLALLAGGLDAAGRTDTGAAPAEAGAPAQPADRDARHRPRRSPRQLSLQAGADAAARRAGRFRPAVRAGVDGGAADVAGALVADDRHVSGVARRPRQRRLLPRRRPADAGRDPARPRFPHRRLRRRVRARSPVGDLAGIRPLLRRFRSRQVRRRVGDGHDPEAGPRGRRSRDPVASGGREAAVLRLGASLRRPRAVRSARAVPVAIPAHPRRRLRRRDCQRRRAGRASPRRAARRRPSRRHARHGRRRSRRDAGRARRADARLLHLRRRHPHPPDHQRPGRARRRHLRPGPHRRRRADSAGAARGAGAEGHAGHRPDAAGARAAPRAGGAQRELVSALPLRLERAARDSGRPLQADSSAAAGALRPGDRSARGARPGAGVGAARRSLRPRARGVRIEDRESRGAAGTARDRFRDRRAARRARVCRAAASA